MAEEPTKEVETQEEEAEKDAEATIEAGADEAAGDATDFTPKVEVSEIEVKTMEEDEIVVFKQRSKIFIFVSKDEYGGEERRNFWKERGTGDLKLLTHKEMGKVRVLMRQEKTLKICANHLVSPTVELKPNVGSDRSWVFTATDFADEELKTETFAVKFGTAESANRFKDCIELAKKINAGELEPSALKAVSEDDAPAKAPAEPKEAPKEDAADSLANDMSKVALCGGFKEADASSEEVQAAAEFAAKEIGKGPLVKVVEAASQVVAGMNFRIVLHITHEEDNAAHSYLVKVFRPLPHENKEMELSEKVHHGVAA
mmetsp:Transcript_17534/g.30899  ORF Transcript_17534/g.30899 Transcript_17534/m.30899 type:complete len:315 (+) Transcript_17534:114-1058(+)|eukprot:CAMPEP_0184508830 /NCGR_PEP_ID=MMETSP0198_2-20121128/964_1 /TAXON_ID=1112570 /ORGANISM="Thraustochytrium sp., Strain LLF1b" /LENGTH=314 /DNA_ID=CAMNT_0026898629 /DNA_START=180 /DNA_END=1124 /DNA_ORIENTATION=+